MSNSFYNHATYPAPNAPGSSAALRAELDLVTAGFNKLPTLAANGYKVAMVNAAGTALIASSALQSLAITGSTLDSTPIGATTRAAGSFTNLSVNGSAGLGTAVTIGGGTIDNTPIGGTTASSGAFTTVSASSGFTGNLTGNVTGDVTGNLTGNVSGNVTAGSGTSTFNNVTINGTLDMNAGTTGTITGLANPVNASDAANKGYVDTVAQGLDVKPSVRVATTASITLSGEQTIDGVAVIAGDRVLVKDQSTASTNGVYVAAAGSWARAVDMDVWAELPGAFLFVEEGTANDNSGWVCTVAAGGTIGSTSVTFEQFSGAGQITAGAGMTKSGNTLNVGTASASRIVVNADNIDLAASGVTASTYKSVTVDIYGRVTAGTNPTTLAGYGITDAYTIAQVDSIFASTTSAAASAAAAAASELAAGNSATAASGSASSASASATAAAASYDSFDDRYLGAKTSDPTVDNDGNALITGALYFNSSAGEMRVYNGSAWVAAYLPAAGYLPISGGTLTGNLLVNAGTDSRYLLQVSGTTQAQLQATASAIRLASNNTTSLVLATNGVDRVTFDSAGNTTFGSVSASGVFKVQGLNTGDLVVFESTDASGTAAPDVVLYRNSSTPAAADQLGVLVWRGKDSDAADQQYARIGAEIVDPTAGSEDGSLWFETVIAGASVERMRLAAAGLGIGTATPARPVHIKTTTGGAEMRFEATAPGGLFSIGASSAANAFVINDNNASATRFQINANGAVAFTSSGTGTAGQVLTSAGSGAAPTWQTIEAGVISALASGSLTSNTPVIINSDGTVSSISGSALTISSETSLNTETAFNAGTRTAVAVNTAGTTVVAHFGKTAYSIGAYVIAGTVSGGTITWGALTAIHTDFRGIYNNNANDIVYLPHLDKFVVAYAGQDNLDVYYVKATLITVTGTSISVGTTQNLITDTTNVKNAVRCVFDPSKNVLAISFYNYSNTTSRVYAFDVSSGLSSWATWINFPYSSSQQYEGFYDALSGSIYYIYQSNSSGHPAIVRLNITNASTVSFGTPVVIASALSGGSSRMAVYDPLSGRYIAAYGLFDTNGTRLRSFAIDASGGITFGTEISIANTSYNSVFIGYNSFANKPWIAYSLNSGGINNIATVNVSGTSLTVSGDAAYTGNGISSASGTVPYVSGLQSNLFIYFRTSSPFGRGYKTITPAYTTATDSNVIGFSSANYTNGQTASVKIIGSTVSGLTGLTPARRYFAQANGTIATTADPNFTAYVGTSLSSTSLLIKG